MSFLSTLGKIFGVVKTVTADVAPAVPLISAIPVVGGPFGVIFNAIWTVEQLFPTPGSGTVKKAVATQVVNANAPGVDPALLSTAIDNIVAALNQMHKAATTVTTPAAP